MDNFAQFSDFSLKRVDMIANHEVRTKTANDLIGISTNKLKGVSRGNTQYTRSREAVPTITNIPVASVNLEDKGIYRHWSPGSQIFVGGDTLLTALDSGWEIKGIALRQIYSCTSNRCTYVYHLDLHRDGERNSIKVSENPWVTRLLHQLQIEIA